MALVDISRRAKTLLTILRLSSRQIPLKMVPGIPIMIPSLSTLPLGPSGGVSVETAASHTVISARIEDGLLTRIDDIVRADPKYKDRSQFLAAALREKLFKDFQDSEIQTFALRKIENEIRAVDDKVSTFIELFGEFIFAFFMSSPPLPLEDPDRMAAIAIPAKRQYEVFLENFIDKTKKSGTGLLSKLTADLIEEQSTRHG